MSSKMLRIWAQADADLERHAGKPGIPLATTLNCVVQVVLADLRVRAMMRRLVVSQTLPKHRSSGT